jgi:hypothetical protein
MEVMHSFETLVFPTRLHGYNPKGHNPHNSVGLCDIRGIVHEFKHDGCSIIIQNVLEKQSYCSRNTELDKLCVSKAVTETEKFYDQFTILS